LNTINIQQKLKSFSAHWHPHQIAVVNDMQVIVAKLKGEFVWHQHDEEDELFQVLRGTLYMQFEDRTEKLEAGEIIVVPRGVKHCPITKDDEEVHVLLFEKTGIKHTGNTESTLTVKDYPKI